MGTKHIIRYRYTLLRWTFTVEVTSNDVSEWEKVLFYVVHRQSLEWTRRVRSLTVNLTWNESVVPDCIMRRGAYDIHSVDQGWQGRKQNYYLPLTLYPWNSDGQWRTSLMQVGISTQVGTEVEFRKKSVWTIVILKSTQDASKQILLLVNSGGIVCKYYANRASIWKTWEHVLLERLWRVWLQMYQVRDSPCSLLIERYCFEVAVKLQIFYYGLIVSCSFPGTESIL